MTQNPAQGCALRRLAQEFARLRAGLRKQKPCAVTRSCASLRRILQAGCTALKPCPYASLAETLRVWRARSLG